jgi:hypothetical protein
MPKRTSYDDLPFLPSIIAETVCSQEYTGQEFSAGSMSLEECEIMETKRKALTEKQINLFALRTDELCKQAYDAKAKWFMSLVKAKGNRGRDQLYVWIRHWMTSFLMNPAKFLHDHI